MTNQSDDNGKLSRIDRDDERPNERASAFGSDGTGSMSRRRFLEAAGFTLSVSALAGCQRADPETAYPFVTQPTGAVPGRTRFFAATCGGCSASCGLLIGVRDGRPLKMEGMPEHPLSRGGLCAVGQALPLGLYDSHRLAHPLSGGKQANWDEVDQAVIRKLDELEDGAIRFVTPTITSPTLMTTIDRFLSRFKNARHITFDALSCSAILDAHTRTHGRRSLPHFRFDKADVIVSFGADFLGTWISPVEFTAAWSSKRAPVQDDVRMSYHVQLEGRMSLTGSNADHRHELAPDEYGPVLSHLAKEFAARAGLPAPVGTAGTPPLPQQDLSSLTEYLWRARGKSLVVSDSQDVEVQVLVNAINHFLGNYGQTLDVERPSWQKQGNDAGVLELIEELKAGEVNALFVYGTDLTHNLPNRTAMAAALKKLPLLVSFAERLDDLSTFAHFVCPDVHSLQAWSDAEPVTGLVSLSQPTMRPLGNARSILETLACWSGSKLSAMDIVQETWKQQIAPRVNPAQFQTFWEKAVHDGFVETPSSVQVGEFQLDAVKLLGDREPQTGISLTLYGKVGMPDTRHAHNAWLQELPDPITKVVWDNYVCVPVALARDLGIADGDVVQVITEAGSRSIELPALVQRGQHDRVLAVALAYGVRDTDRFADIGPNWIDARPTTAPGTPVGRNAALFIGAKDGTFRYDCDDVELKKTGRRYDLAMTQKYSSMAVPSAVAPRGGELREPIQQTTLTEFAADPQAGTPHAHVHSEEQLWPEDHQKHGHSWGMVIDLNKCTGCSACLVACQSENNVPVVGKDEVRRQREMHWIRIDRYYSGDEGSVEVAFQPMMCQHCGNAACETVCPVLATVHDDEGLNEQVYNRCVGTRYCANNCPYKVRRFNWFRYEHEDEVQNLVLNPDVTVRARGVMEKCSMCVQRIEEARIDARRNSQSLADGQVLTACQQSCPSQAIVFGDMNDPESQVQIADKNARKYRVLGEFNFRPSVEYLRMVRNRDAEVSDHGDHV